MQRCRRCRAPLARWPPVTYVISDSPESAPPFRLAMPLRNLSTAFGGGPAWVNSDVLPLGWSMKSSSPPNLQHSCDEYIEQVISIIGRTEAHMASLLYASEHSRALEDGPRGGPYPLCTSCGGLPATIRPPISLVTTPLPPDAGLVRDIADLILGDDVPQGPLEQNSADCLALLPNGALCDAPLPSSRSGRADVGGNEILVLVLGREADGDRGLRENRTKMSNSSLIHQAGATWRIRAAVSHVGDHLDSGHYVAIFALPTSEYMFASDDRVLGPMTFDSAWSMIRDEPVVLFYSEELSDL